MRFKFNQQSNDAITVMESLTPAMFISRYYEGKDSFREMDAELLQFAPTLRANLEKFFSYVREGQKINSMIARRKHTKSSMPYLRFEVGLRNGNVPVMLFDCDNLSQFVEQYQKGEVKVDFSYNDLMSYVNS